MDLPAGILTIRESKFYKTRLVPMSPALTAILENYVAQRAKEHSTKLDAALFLTRTATPLVRRTAACESGQACCVTTAAVISRVFMT